ncbi:hypothetical protein [Psychrobacter sp. I-STPA10]|nr:hypothetical protein [Psychrobacter sp. I-STPA10]
MRKSTFFKLSMVGAILLLLPRRSSKSDRLAQNSDPDKNKPIDK